jgi:hypothetical protein
MAIPTVIRTAELAGQDRPAPRRYHRRMSRRVCAFLLTLALLWQPFSALLPAGLDAQADRITHAVVHGQALGHHHHDDTTLHLDADEPGHQHVLDGMQFPALTAGCAGFEPVAPPTGVDAADALLPPSVDARRLLRPPRARSA